MNAGVLLLAWLDEDRIRDAFPGAAGASPAEVVSLVKGRAKDLDPARVEVFLLERNLESLLEALARPLSDALGAETVQRALDKRGSAAVDCRDQCLLQIANTRSLRELLRDRHAGFEWVTRYVAEIVTREPWLLG